jgi:hypothetical protein
VASTFHNEPSVCQDLFDLLKNLKTRARDAA